MRKSIGHFVIFIFLILSIDVFANSDVCTNWSQIKGGDSRPWPWGSEMALPWSSIDGTWVGTVGNCKSYFMFKMVTVRSGNAKKLWFGQVDPKACKIVAEGYGTEKKNVITGRLVDTSGKVFTITIRTFDSGVLSSTGKEGNTRPSKEKVFVATLQPSSGRPGFVSFELKKLSSKTNGLNNCKSRNRP